VERIISDSGNDVSGLLNFGTITFTDCAGSTAEAPASLFPIDGSTLDMTNGLGAGAATTAIDSAGSGDSFTITWMSE
jgi:hypothetical protein